MGSKYFVIVKILTILSNVQAGMALGELQSLGDLYDMQSISILFFIGLASVIPTMISNTSEP